MGSIYDAYIPKALSNVISARQALKAYNTINQKDLKNVAAYHAQQAIELLLKYKIYTNKQYYQNNTDKNGTIKEIYKHDIDKLIKSYCDKYGIKDIPSKIRKNAVMYTNWEAGSRYGLSFSVKITSIESVLTEIENWIVKIRPSYRAKITEVKNKLNY